ncbi:MAG: ABC transporter permease, partial [Shinella sp.]
MTPILADSAAPRSRTQRQSILKQIMGMPAGAIFLVFMTLQIVCIAGALLYPNEFRYLSPQNLTILMKAIPVLGCLALGAGVLMIGGEFDLSIG